jgi:aspartyl protease family protein
MSKPGIIRPEIRYLLYFGAFWVALLAVATYWLGNREAHKTNPNQQLVSQTRDGAIEIELKANRQGHYLADGTINTRHVTFILDTGATTVSVSEAIAREAGLPREQCHQLT